RSLGELERPNGIVWNDPEANLRDSSTLVASTEPDLAISAYRVDAVGARADSHAFPRGQLRAREDADRGSFEKWRERRFQVKPQRVVVGCLDRLEEREILALRRCDFWIEDRFVSGEDIGGRERAAVGEGGVGADPQTHAERPVESPVDGKVWDVLQMLVEPGERTEDQLVDPG